ncbi:unnamed protein product [Aspergillus oryzae]|nr:unnamed protein product [Aspergillus oryzae]
MPDTAPTTCENRDVQLTSHYTPQCEIEQTQRNFDEAQDNSRKGMPWSAEAKKDERRPWSEITRLFSNQYPSRSQGSIYVHWSTTLKNKTP